MYLKPAICPNTHRVHNIYHLLLKTNSKYPTAHPIKNITVPKLNTQLTLFFSCGYKAGRTNFHISHIRYGNVNSTAIQNADDMCVKNGPVREVLNISG